MIYFKLDALLKQLNYSRNRFSQLSGVRPNTINDMCNGNTKRLELETLNAILEALNRISQRPIDISDLIEFKKEDKK
ncbi:helix-turn-helix transcriptional regulator [Anoxybacillus rupiensis]|uniref:helix-turn-helix domain-containing protein n=1 Tax=Anoxybacteroides rupiense TaxID=311460 RepID=UPI001BAA2A8D|nr:helix-turn-helix transcriptional regulator [Anoxybacillus rupiensis]MBS2773019.1 helix-turn-helix transcriptional regulator [Anoxybacillus rupiensis]